ncbi:MAG: hypothetical protein ACI8UO_003515, partial [Verrucomicrobiales bacterium]
FPQRGGKIALRGRSWHPDFCPEQSRFGRDVPAGNDFQTFQNHVRLSAFRELSTNFDLFQEPVDRLVDPVVNRTPIQLVVVLKFPLLLFVIRKMPFIQESIVRHDRV